MEFRIEDDDQGYIVQGEPWGEDPNGEQLHIWRIVWRKDNAGTEAE